MGVIFAAVTPTPPAVDRPCQTRNDSIVSSAVSRAPVANASAARLRYEALFSRPADLAMVFVPVLATALTFAIASHLGQNVRGSANTYLLWVAAYVFGNTSHVVLTFLMLGARRDMLHSTERQARTVGVGSLAVFAVALFLGRTTRDVPTAQILFSVVVSVFAIHHTMSQAKGFWALYSLRGAKAGLPPPSARERELQKHFVPLVLLLVAIKWTLVGDGPAAVAQPFLNVNPGYPAVLPFAVTYGLIAAWLVFVVILFQALLTYETLNAAKLVYLGTQCAVVTVELVAPGWGVTMAAGIHGLEYFLLTRKMLAPTGSEAASRLTSSLVGPAMLAAMSPVFVVALVYNPWFAVNVGSTARLWGGILVTAVTLAHYYADAFIYRFRVPGVRKVALARLGLD
jgi:hypothetical protein